MTESSMLAFILRRARASVALLAPYDKLRRRLLKAALALFGSAEAAPRVQAALLVRAMALALPPPALDACLKGAYRAFAASARFTSAASAPAISFMGAVVVELHGIDPAASYQHAFGAVRQLALTLRSALTSKSKDAYREVYCWRYVHCLELWAQVLAAHAAGGELRPLVYPVAQLLLGAARLVPTPGYFPLRLRLARALNRLAAAAGAYAPVAPLALEVLQWGDLGRAPRGAPGDRPPDLSLTLRAGKAALRSAALQGDVVDAALEVLADHLAQWACHPAFPELAHLPAAALRKFAKRTQVERFRKGARTLADAADRNAQFVGRARDAADFAPRDLAAVASFLAAEAAAGSAPLAKHAAALAERARERAALRAAGEVEVGEVRSGDSSSDEGVPAPAARKRKAASSEDEEEEPPRAAKALKRVAKAEAAPPPSDSDEDAAMFSEGEEEDGGADEIAAYELSSDDEDAGEAPRARAPAAAGRGRGRGGRDGERGGRSGRRGGHDGGRGGGRFSDGGGRGGGGRFGARGGRDGGRGRSPGGRGGGRDGGRGRGGSRGGSRGGRR
jgi:nucleolar complex protein 2